MPRHLNLVESDFEQLEKRILPRFPFCFLTFKCRENSTHIFEVEDISHSGMQLSLKLGEHNLKEDENIHGNLHWGTKELEISGNIKWTTDMRLGVEFSTSANARTEVDEFLDLEYIAKLMKPVHQLDGIEIPSMLKFWLRADGPIELFVWPHSDGELARFQVILMENFIEWEDGKGLKTARVISKRDIDTPLITEDEFVFQVDQVIDEDKVARALTLINNIDPEHLTSDVIEFMQIKLRS